MVKLIKSITKSISHGVKNDPEVQRLKDKHPKTVAFLQNRFTKDHKFGLYFTIGIAITLFFIYLFFGIVQDYIGQEKLVQFDLRVINLFSMLRHPKLTQQLLFITYLAKGEVIAVGVLVASFIFILFKKWRFFYTLLISVGGGELFVWIIKNILDRPRPPLTNALVAETSYSFPSGHTFVAIAFYGLLAYFVIQSEKNKFLKIISFIFAFFLIVLVGVSRIYLGAHWPSDVFASFAAGSAWLSILITSLKIKKKFTPLQNISLHIKKSTIIICSISSILLWLAFVFCFYFTHPLQNKEIVPTVKAVIETKDIASQLFEKLPKVSESIASLPAEPINIIFVGRKQELDNAFIKSGWYLLDGPSIKSYIKIVISIILKKSYPQTPGLPVFWDTQPSQFAYGKPTSTNSISSREHIHLWDTGFITEDQQSIWVGTAHFDQAIQKKLGLIMPYHTTEIRVDNERESIKNELDQNGFIQKTEKIDLTGLLYGSKKGSGNSFLTDGQAHIIYLKNKNEKR